MDGDPDRPPFFRSWSGIYFLVIAGLVLQVIAFTLISRAYR